MISAPIRYILREKARKLEPEINTVLKEWRGILTDGFTEEEKELAHTLLERMGQNAAAHMTRSGTSAKGGAAS